MAIGRLKVETVEQTDPETGEVEQVEQVNGEVRTLRIALKLRLVAIPAADRGSDRAPDYLVYGNLVGHWAEIGKAWARRIERGEQAGRQMFSINIEEEEVAEGTGAWVSAFPLRGEAAAYEIVRERKRQEGAA